MSKPSSRGIAVGRRRRARRRSSRSARSLTSTTRRQVTRRTSMSSCVAVVDVVVDQRGQQVVGERDRGEVAGEVQVDVLHRHDLRVAAAGRAALHAEHRAQRRLAQADHRPLAHAGCSASARPTVVVVLPSPAGVGEIAVIRISLPSGRSLEAARGSRATPSPCSGRRARGVLGDPEALARQRHDRAHAVPRWAISMLLRTGAAASAGFADIVCFGA